MIDKLSTEEKVDLAISLMILPIEPAVKLANACLDNISRVEFRSACYELITSRVVKLRIRAYPKFRKKN